MNQSQRPHWQLPPGITRGMWDYAHKLSVARDYDAYFEFNELFEFDEQVVLDSLRAGDARPGQCVADLGCGSGRALVKLTRHGYRGLAIDISEPMLEVVREKVCADELPIDCLRANLVELDCLADQSVDHAISLFSTLGMIRGRQNRLQALRHVHRILRPGGVFVLHVHNYWYNLYDPLGPWWLIGNLGRAVFVRDVETGDKFFNYRGVHNMFLHVFRRGELLRQLRLAGFAVRDFIHLDPRRRRRLPLAWLVPNLRANGWIVVARRSL